MKKINIIRFQLIASIAISSMILVGCNRNSNENNFVFYEVDTKSHDIKMYLKDDTGKLLQTIGQLKSWLASKNEKLLFAMNGGMYKSDNTPKGLFIENQEVVSQLDTTLGSGNFYLQPNGVFYITTNKTAAIASTSNFTRNSNIIYATQSGPMLLIDGQINPIFTKGSPNLHIRNGVGILSNNKVVFAMSKNEVSFYEFANYFQKKGCKNALFLDGFVSRMYLPEKDWIQTDGNFDVIIGITQRAD